MDISIVIVNYNVKYFVEQAIASIYQSNTTLKYEILVVDNNSSDGSVEMILQKYPEVRLFALEENLGFSKANNIGFREARGDYCLILNPDTLIQEDSLDRCYQYLENKLDVGALGVRMIDGSGSFLPESKRGFPKLATAFFKTTGIYRLFPSSEYFNSYYQGHIDENQTAEVDVLSGAFIFVRKSLLDLVGGFDERYFMYGEDIDLSYQMQKQGYKNVYFPQTTIIHYKGESTKKGSLNYVKVFYQAMILFAEKNLKKNGRILIALLKAAIYFRGLITVVGNFVNRLWMPVLEISLSLFAAMYFKDIWAHYYYDDPKYYRNSVTLVNYGIYAGTYALNSWLFGSYDSSFSLKKLLKAFFSTALICFSFYALLGESYRSSRILLVSYLVLAFLSSFIIRSIYHRWFHNSFAFFRSEPLRAGVVGSKEEFSRILKISHDIQLPYLICGRISLETSDIDTLGYLNDLEDIVSAHDLNCVIFCTKDVENTTIMYWMSEMTDQIEYKVLPVESDSIIGSSSKDISGELFTVDMQYKITRPENRRAKRLFDISSSVILLICSLPFTFKSSGRNIWSNAAMVLLGKKTWISYKNSHTSSLPKLADGVFDILAIKGTGDLVSNNMTKFTYARDYHWRIDLSYLSSILFKQNI